ncbi:MAG TPA: MFS transporter [Micromonosporaceae bacterium]
MRAVAFAAAVVVAAISVLFGPTAPAVAGPTLQDQCTVQEWRDPGNFSRCVGQLHDLSQQRAQCLAAPIPEPPDSGMAGWFVTEPESSKLSGPQGLYSRYGYAGYDYTTYDIGCVPTLMHPDYKFENTIANAEFMFATGVIGASNALREKAWQPQSMWGWADTLVDKATKAIYQRVFTVFGAVTLAVVGLYLLWRSRQSDMSAAMTTAGWAILVMVAVTAIAAWPVRSAHLADQSLIQGLGVVHGAVGPQPKDIPPDKCVLPDPAACKDVRPPAVRASDTATETMLYRNWLRGALGSADSLTARKYGPALYDAKSLSWDEAERIRENPSTRDATIAQKQNQWMKVAEQIKTEDPQAYEYLQGTRGMDRIGAGFIAILSALFFAMFDVTASVLVLLGFLIFRWAVVAAPVLGTVGMLRPASSGLRRLVNSVIAAMFNIVIFGTGAAIYLFAVDLIMSSAALPGWLQVTLVWLCGVVGWLLLRPYRRITQLGGKDSTGAIATAGTWHRRFFRDLREAATLAIATPAVESVVDRRREARSEVLRPEARAEDPVEARTARPESATPRQRAVTAEWVEADVPDTPTGYAVYRPKSRAAKPPQAPAPRPESANVG